jgi:hypothetical protein
MGAVIPMQEVLRVGLAISCSLIRPPSYESTSVEEPDPYVFGPPGYGSVSTRYGSGSENLPSKSNKQKNLEKNSFFL